MEHIVSLKSLEGNFTSIKCIYCGSETLSNGTEALCHFCEGYVSVAEPVGSSDMEALGAIQTSILGNDINKARELLEKYAGKDSGSDVNRLYGYANFYRFFSDYVYYDRNYAGKGFMEQNSANIYDSLDLTAKSKEFFHKLAYVIEHDEHMAKEQKMLHMQFIANIKLKRLFYAKKALDKMYEVNGKDLLATYDSMVYAVESNDKDAQQLINEVAKQDILNAFYYMARYLVNNKEIAHADNILAALINKCHMPVALFMLHKIRVLEEETAL